MYSVKGFAERDEDDKMREREREGDGKRRVMRERIMRVEEPRDPEKSEGWVRFKVSAGVGSRYVKQMADG